MKLWVDDLRDPPDDTWLVARDSRWACAVLNWMRGKVEVMSLDHDLGGEDTTRAVLLWLIEDVESPSPWPTEIRIHTANPVGRTWLTAMIERYKPTGG